MKFCFVIHRAAPFPGGTEQYVQNLAEGAQGRGHEVTILAGLHRGPVNGIRVTSDQDILGSERFDLVIVHGSTDGSPRDTLDRAAELPSPVLYLLVAHRAEHIRRKHLRNAPLLGWSTPLDQEAIARAGATDRAVRVRHGIDPAQSLGKPGFRARHGIAPDRLMFLSCGGYAANKRMRALARTFRRMPGDALLVTTGYNAQRWQMPRRGPRVLPLMLEDREEVLSAIAEADCYVMHSRDEGFGLVLLEAMLNRTPWIARRTGGATVLGDFGQTYESDAELRELLEAFERDEERVARAERAVTGGHTIAHCINDLEAAATRAERR
ncbi:MAG: glycosyltransferase family 4 protein [Pseudomonadota bacterium]